LVAAERPNLLFIMSDDHASHAISAYGSAINQTPHLDRIAAEGMRMDAVFCTNSICTPSRAAILTGTYSHINGVTTLDTPMDDSLWTFPQALQAAGYHTALFGKWHLGHGRGHDPQGFDVWAVLPGQGHYHNPVMLERRRDGSSPRVVERRGYVTDVITDDCLRFLDELDDGRPFALFCHQKASHRHWEPDAKHARMFENVSIPEPATLHDDLTTKPKVVRAVRMRMMDLDPWRDLKSFPPDGMTEYEEVSWRYQRYIKDYLRVVASIDDNVGRLLDRLDADGLTEDTIVVYTSDQGVFLGDHGWFDKRLMYEESIRMPLLIRYPPVVKPGSTNDDIVVNVDFAPTFLDLADVDVPAQVQGRSFSTLLRGTTPPHWPKSMYYRYWMHRDEAVQAPAHYGVRTRTHKLIAYYNDPLGQPGANGPVDPPAWELYDLSNDPHETRNLIHDPSSRAVRDTLVAELTHLQQHLGDDPHAAVADGPRDHTRPARRSVQPPGRLREKQSTEKRE
jgi:arylsulfatase A-like enzyme